MAKSVRVDVSDLSPTAELALKHALEDSGFAVSRKDDEDFGQEWDCTHCGGEGTCDDNSDPLGNCGDQPHPCHACGGSGLRRDQRIF